MNVAYDLIVFFELNTSIKFKRLKPKKKIMIENFFNYLITRKIKKLNGKLIIKIIRY